MSKESSVSVSNRNVCSWFIVFLPSLIENKASCEVT